MRFNPFEKAIVEVQAPDLSVLRQVSEGLYVEYKREVPNAAAIAKSLSAFANHNGGWVFYGIEEHPIDRNAAAFPGIPTADVPGLVDRIRDAAAHNVSPAPTLEIKVVHGPCAALDLLDDRSIIVVAVPLGVDAPYVHSSGRIYRRFIDSSDPRPEADRSVIDQLVTRSKTGRDAIRRVLTKDPEFATSEKETVYLQLYLLRDPLGEEQQTRLILFEEFVSVMQSTEGEIGDFVCDNIYAAAAGFIARQVTTNEHHRKTLTWEYFQGGSSLITAPLRTGSLDLLLKYKYGNEFLNVLADPSRAARVLDLTILLALLNGLLAKQRRLCGLAGFRGRMLAKVRLHHTWRKIPYLDTAAFRDFVSKYGVPLIQYKELFAPSGLSLESLASLWISESDRTKEEQNQAGVPVEFFSQIMAALGIPTLVLANSDTELFEAVNRAPGVNRIRP